MFERPKNILKVDCKTYHMYNWIPLYRYSARYLVKYQVVRLVYALFFFCGLETFYFSEKSF